MCLYCLKSDNYYWRFYANTTSIFIFRLFFVFSISVPSLSQPILDSAIHIIYVDNKSIDDIVSINNANLEPIIYLNIPQFSDLAVKEKKQKFIDFILPAILIEKQKIYKAYQYVVDNFDSMHVTNEKNQSFYDYCDCDNTEDLLLCFTDQPTSIILAQAAIESGWGTSRFFLEGLNLFGMHTYNKQHMKAQNSSRVYVKKYSSISESISHYLRTLARASAYSEFRKKRANSKDVNYMINYLTNYSERRELYINDIETIIEYNRLSRYDTLVINN